MIADFLKVAFLGYFYLYNPCHNIFYFLFKIYRINF